MSDDFCWQCGQRAPEEWPADPCKCGVHPAEEPHRCPYQCDVNDIHDDDYCRCCDCCTQQCCDDI